jgi:hypothetical protein
VGSGSSIQQQQEVLAAFQCQRHCSRLQSHGIRQQKTQSLTEKNIKLFAWQRHLIEKAR